MEESFKKVLDKGFVRLIDMMGDDLSAVRSARVSYGKELTTPERDRKLIEYLMKHGHETPFEHIVFTFHVKCPIFVARQWFRHRIASYNEISGRYTKLKDEFYIPDKIRIPDEKDRQKSIPNDGKVDEEKAKKLMIESFESSYRIYQKLLEMGLAREMARIVLPLSIYTEFYWTVNARSLMNFLNLRADSHAQWEIQQYALAIASIFEEKCPWTFNAFLEYRYKGDLLKGGR